MDFHWKHCRSQDSTSQQGGCQDSLALKLNGYAKKKMSIQPTEMLDLDFFMKNLGEFHEMMENSCTEK